MLNMKHRDHASFCRRIWWGHVEGEKTPALCVYTRRHIFSDSPRLFVQTWPGYLSNIVQIPYLVGTEFSGVLNLLNLFAQLFNMKFAVLVGLSCLFVEHGLAFVLILLATFVSQNMIPFFARTGEGMQYRRIIIKSPLLYWRPMRRLWKVRDGVWDWHSSSKSHKLRLLRFFRKPTS